MYIAGFDIDEKQLDKMQSQDWSSMVDKEEKQQERKIKWVRSVVALQWLCTQFLFKDYIVNSVIYVERFS